MSKYGAGNKASRGPGSIKVNMQAPTRLVITSHRATSVNRIKVRDEKGDGRSRNTTSKRDGLAAKHGHYEN